MATWVDFAALLCLALTVLGVAALSVAASTFAIVKGKVIDIGTAFIDSGEGRTQTMTVTILLENPDRVYRIDRGTAVEYAISDDDARLVQVGSELTLKISLHERKATVIDVEHVR
jgi:hypothetical protein